ncbi:MAG: ABC transporter permease [Anaerolineales bacterium]|nr:MAG: ABC transporter permease [Anaerolineales bacterium]
MEAPKINAGKDIFVDKELLERPHYSAWRDMFKRLVRNRVAFASMFIIIGLALSAILAPLIAPYGRDEPDFDHTREGPILAHWFGTDKLGRDVLTRIMYGGQVSLGVAFIGSITALVIGVFYGALSGYGGGRIDDLMMRFVDLMYGFPTLLFIILLMLVIPPNASNAVALTGLFIGLGVVSWLGVARLVRGQFLSLREKEFVEAAVALGASPFRIIFRHILPNSLGPIIVWLMLSIPGLIMVESTLSFIGLGVKPPTPSWGSMLAEGWRAMRTSPWLAVAPAGAIALTMLVFNFFGDGLRDALDPTMRGRE